MKITILSVGKTKSMDFANLEDKYIKRIQGRFECERRYVRNDAELVEALVHSSATVVLMDEQGKSYTSALFADYLDQKSLVTSQLVFVLGGPDGLPKETMDMKVEIIALSEMTFPHEMARVVLIEQIYRAKTILENHPYHK